MSTSVRHYRTCHLCDDLMKPGQRQTEFKLVTGDVVNVHQVCIDTEPEEDDNEDPFEFVREQASKSKIGNPTVELVKMDDLPPLNRGSRTFFGMVQEQLATIRSDPGQWYRILNFDGDTRAASRARQGLVRTAAGFEFSARDGGVYARFTGDG